MFRNVFIGGFFIFKMFSRKQQRNYLLTGLLVVLASSRVNALDFQILSKVFLGSEESNQNDQVSDQIVFEPKTDIKPVGVNVNAPDHALHKSNSETAVFDKKEVLNLDPQKINKSSLNLSIDNLKLNDFNVVLAQQPQSPSDLNNGSIQAPLGADDMHIDLEGLLRVALERNSGLKVQKAELDASKSDLSASEWQRYPSFSLEQQTLSSSDNSTTAIIEQPIWSGGEITAQIGVAEYAYLEQKSQYDEALLSLLVDISAAYFDVLRLAKRQEVAQENSEQHKKFLSAIRRRVDAQISPQADYVLADARLQQALRQEFLSEQELSSRQAELERLTESSFKPSEVFSKLTLPPDLLEDYVTNVVKNSPILTGLKASIEKARKLVDRERSSLWPKVVGQITSSRLSSTNDFSDPSYNLVLKYNTGNGFANSDKIKATNLRLDSASSELNYETSKIRQEAIQMLRRHKSLEAQVDPAEKLKESTGIVIESYLRQFKIGKKSWLDVLNAQREKTDALNAAYDNRYVLEAVKFEMLLMTDWSGFRKKYSL